MNEEYNGIDPEEIIIKLKELLEYLKKLKQKENNGEELANTPILGN